MIPLWGQVSLDPIRCTGKREPPDAEDDQDDVREEGCDVDDRTGSLDPLEEADGD